MADKALGLLGLMRRARAVEAGTDNACDAVHAGKAKLLILSDDIADNARRKAENAANGRRVLLLRVHYTRAELAAALGLGDCSTAAVTDLGFASAFVQALAADQPERYGEAAQELQRRNAKAVRRRKEKADRADSKRNGKRRTEV
ncbi:MAG: ribosomal L7Ae/L30e/S12e/Gadd45 family protein [Oscillospiraceae bacterium]|nr:ribosomal L7Ae/L30e/S12e/Gadd45 family protein [Oscillospiraceae bacterium]